MAKLIFRGMFAMTLTVHCILGWKIWQKKKTLSYLGSATNHQARIFILCHSPQLKKSTDSSILDDISSVVFFVVFLVLVPSLLVALVFLGGLPQVVTLRLATVAFLVVVLPLLVYVRKPHVRTILARELKESLSWS